ncbi:hypothetical protein ABPG72_011531 [Tetrahymena utriculariae]
MNINALNQQLNFLQQAFHPNNTIKQNQFINFENFSKAYSSIIKQLSFHRIQIKHSVQQWQRLLAVAQLRISKRAGRQKQRNKQALQELEIKKKGDRRKRSTVQVIQQVKQNNYIYSQLLISLFILVSQSICQFIYLYFCIYNSYAVIKKIDSTQISIKTEINIK